MKKSLLAIISLAILINVLPSYANGIDITVYHRGNEGVKKLTNTRLFLQRVNKMSIYVKTNDDAVFTLPDSDASVVIRAYLVAPNGSTVAGCFSRFVAAKYRLLSLKGVDCP